MAHAKNHDYHVLPPSIWPLLGALAGFVMLFGSVLWMHGSGPWMGLIGLAGVLYVMFAWWSEVVHEGQTGDHTPVVRLGLRYGFILFIMSEVMFFSAWFWTFFKHRMYPMGPDSPPSTASGRPPGSRRSTPGTCPSSTR
jgi:cytochrome c oxidase subunit 3